jgi:ubiquinone/menaquinone biosynthesis C-methylase UbiE
MNERIYNKEIDRLRSEERIKRLEIDKVVSLCLQGKDLKTLLDVGTGSGLFAEAFSKSGLVVSGIDINKEMVDSAKIFLPESTFKVASAEDIPFKNATFDATFLGLVFHEVTDYTKSLKEAHRVSRYFTFILEWQYKEEDFGPPIEHRLTPEFIKDIALSVGYISLNTILLSNLVLYILEKKNDATIYKK